MKIKAMFPYGNIGKKRVKQFLLIQIKTYEPQ